jgi:hypothetical protein
MAEKVIDWFPRLTSIVSLLVSIVGLGSFVISYRALRQADENLRITSYQQMVSQSVDIDKAIVEHPSMRPYFRDRKPISPGDKDYDLAAGIAELRIASFGALLTLPHFLGAETGITGWRNTVRDAFRDSPLMCEIFTTYKSNYGSEVTRLAIEGCSMAGR